MCIEACCSFCHYKNQQLDHNIIEISDEETIKKENFNLESYVNDFNEYFNRTNSLKQEIEKEMERINKIYDEANNEITKIYKNKYEKLKKEEEDLRKKIEMEVTKIKENLEIYLLESIEQIKQNEIINKGIKFLGDLKELNNYKTLNYISRINKVNNKMENLLYKNMANLKLNINENNIILDEYYFNGIPCPKNIKYNIDSNIFNYNVRISWKIDDNFINIDNKKGTFIVEMSKNNSKYKEVYRGNDDHCVIPLEANSIHQFKIGFLYKDMIGYSNEKINVQPGSNFNPQTSNAFKNSNNLFNIFK